MTPRFVSPFGRLLVAPAEVVAGLRVLGAIAEHTKRMAGHTVLLRDIVERLDFVREDTSALKDLSSEMSKVAASTAFVEPMDRRMANIEGAMPVLVEVQQHLARVPETLERLDGRIDHLNATLDKLLVSLEGLAASVDGLQGSIGPIGRLARRFPGQSRADRRANQAPAD